jgi:hypothetical protein
MDFSKLVGLSTEEIQDNIQYAYCVYCILRWQEDIPGIFDINNIDRRMYKKQILEAIQESEKLKKEGAPTEYPTEQKEVKKEENGNVTTFKPFEIHYRTVEYNLEDAENAITSVLNLGKTHTKEVKVILRNYVSFIVYNYNPKYLRSKIVLDTINQHGGTYLRQAMFRINLLLENTNQVADVLIPFNTMGKFKMPLNLYTDYNSLGVINGYLIEYEKNTLVESMDKLFENMKLFSRLFEKVRFEKVEGIYITGSIIEACLVEKRMNKGKDLKAVFDELYPNADLDICIKSSEPAELEVVANKIRDMVYEHDNDVVLTKMSDRKWRLQSNLGEADVYMLYDPIKRIREHHLACARAMLVCGEVPTLFAFPSFMYAVWNSLNINMNWGSSKNDARECILKYLRRGYGIILNQADYIEVIKYITEIYPGGERLSKKIYKEDLNYRELTKCSKGLSVPPIKN